jgi:chemotaxis response regulator CheB
MSTKRIILANDSRLLREMFHRVIDKANYLEVVQEIPNNEELPFAIEKFCPEWVISSLPMSNTTLNWINSRIEASPTVQFIFLSPDNNSIKMKRQISHEEDLSNLSLKEFIHILEKDLQNI